MNRLLLSALVASVSLLLSACPPLGGSGDDDDDSTIDEGSPSGATTVTLETSAGDIVIELFEEEAPVTTQNFLAYVDSGFYDGSDELGETIFHRVIPGFVVQGGGLTVDMVVKDTLPPIVNESDNGISNTRGTLSMARTSAPDSATSQFFVNLVDNDGLDIDGSFPPGYAVFAEVIDGMDIVDEIAAVATGSVGGYDDVPTTPILITSATAE